MGADIKANTWGGGALERGHGAALEPLAQLGDALGVVGTVTECIEAAELVVGQAAKGRAVSMGPLTLTACLSPWQCRRGSASDRRAQGHKAD